MKFLLGHNLKIFIQWRRNQPLVGGIKLWWESLLGRGNEQIIGLYGGLPHPTPIPQQGKPCKGRAKFEKIKRKNGCFQNKFVKNRLNVKTLFAQHLTYRYFSRSQYYILLMSYYTHFIHTIYLLKWFENNYFSMMLWLEPNLEVHCKLFYSANVMKEGIFSKWR